MQPVLRVFKHTEYSIFLSGMALALVGVWMQRIAVGWTVWTMTGSTAWLGVLAFLDLAPVLAIGLIGGALADRFNRRRLLLACEAVVLLVAVALGVLSLAGAMTLPMLLVAVFTNGVAVGMGQSSRLALVWSLVPSRDLTAAVALNSIAFNLARFIGPAIAGTIMLEVDTGYVFVVNAALSMVFVGTLMAIGRPNQNAARTPSLDRPRAQSLLDEILAGWRYILKHEALGPLLILHVVLCTAIRPVAEMLPALSTTIVGGGPEAMALLASTIGVGAVIGGVLMLVCHAMSLGLANAAMVAAATAASSSLGLSVATGAEAALPAFLLFGTAIGASGIAIHTVIQLAIDPRMRGRIASIDGLIYRGGPAVGALVMGAMGDLVGLRWPIRVGAFAAFAALGVALASLRATEASEAAHRDAEGRAPADGNAP